MINDINLYDLLDDMEEEYIEYDVEREWERVLLPILMTNPYGTINE